MADMLHIDVINRLIDIELTKAKAKYGPRQFDVLVLEGSRGGTISDMELLAALRSSISPDRASKPS